MRTLSNRSSLAALAALTALTALAGCAPRGPAPRCGTAGGVQCAEAMTWDFEEQCPDALCGFRAVQGAARRTEPYGPGEHVLEIDSGAMVEAGVSLDTPSTQEAVGLLARCDAGTSLRVEETAYAWTAAADGASTPRASVDRVVLHPGAEWEVVNARFGARGAGEFSQRVLVRFAADGPGSCSIDEIAFGALEANRVQE